jgi:predicted MFS family arabinose efflux permease
MLQRIQTLYLLIALVAVGVSLVMDWVTYVMEEASTSFMTGNPAMVMYVLVGLSMLTLVLVISRFKDRKGQMKLANVAMFDMLLIVVMFGVLHYQQIESYNELGELSLSYDLGVAMPLIAIVLIWMAKKAIKKDDDLVKSVDRLR